MGGRGGARGGGGGGGGGGKKPEAVPKNVRNLEKKLKYAQDQRRSVISHALTVKWDKRVADLTHKLNMARGRAGV